MKYYALKRGALRYVGVPPKILLIMKMIVVILTTCLMQVSAAGFAQKLTLSKKRATLEQIFTEIRKQTGYYVVYAENKVDKTAKLDVNFNNADLRDVLDVVSKSQNLEYTFDERNVSLKPKEPSFLDRLIDRFAAIDVRGLVVDKAGLPLVSATVMVKGTNKATKTDSKGGFYLANVDEKARLVITYTGFRTLEIGVKEYLGNIILEESDNPLDEVQVIAYGTTTRRLSTGNISSVKAEEIARQPISNPLLALQGRVPGLVINQQNGIPGGEIQVQIQGRNSIQSGNDPFYVVDGVPFNAKMLPTQVGILGGSGSPFSYLNPGDIESIEVLKDADATSIYGSRAANGAILITTKKGKAGKTKFDLNMQQGWGQISRKMDLMNTQQYIALRKEAKKNDNAAIGATDYDINGVWDATKNTDWQKEFAGETADFTNVQASVSGGTSETQFLVGAAFIRERTVFPGDFADIKGSVNLNLIHTSTNRKFQLQLSVNYLNDHNRLPNTDPMSSALSLAPNAPDWQNADGSLNWGVLPNGTTTFANPMNKIVQPYDSETANLISNAIFSYEVLPGLNLRSSFGFNKISTDEKSITPITFYDPTSTLKQRRAYYANKSNTGVIVEPQVEYRRKIAYGNLNVLIGGSYQQNLSDLMAFQGTGYNSDVELANIRSASAITVVNSIQNVYRYNALFGRVNYTYNDKYIVNVATRRDGSSRFGSENRFHNFYSVGAGWIFSEEGFFKKNVSPLSFGKLHMSYGTTGNDQLPDYAYLSLYAPATTGITVPYQSVTGIAATGHANPYLQWELTRKFDIGMDLTFLSNRILLNINYFRNSSGNQLLSNPLPIQTGFASVQKNFPATVNNYGWEMELNTAVLKSNVIWSTNFNFTLPYNKLAAFSNLAAMPSYANAYIIGQPITISKVFKFNGVNQQTGLYEFMDSKGTVVANPNSLTDRYILINTAPKFYGGWGNNINYKGFELDFLIQYMKREGQNALTRFGNTVSGFFNVNQPVSVLERWQQPGDIKDVQKTNSTFSLFTSVNNANNSDAAYGDISFISLRNASLRYNLPGNLLNKLHLGTASVYVQGQNLLMITPFKGLNPETSASISLPLLRMISAGFRINF